jgi:hypothetical protein
MSPRSSNLAFRESKAPATAVPSLDPFPQRVADIEESRDPLMSSQYSVTASSRIAKTSTGSPFWPQDGRSGSRHRGRAPPRWRHAAGRTVTGVVALVRRSDNSPSVTQTRSGRFRWSATLPRTTLLGQQQ